MKTIVCLSDEFVFLIGYAYRMQNPFAMVLVVGWLMACAPLARPSTPVPSRQPARALATVTTTPDSKMNDTLIGAAERGETQMVLNLLARGASLNAQDARGRTAVLAATQKNHVDTVRALIQAGADINIRDARSDNPFLYSGAEGLLDILKLLIAARADTRLTNRFGGTALIPAAERGHVEVVELLLTETDVDVNHINNLGWTALLEAIILSDGGPRHQQIVRLLIEHGADVSIADKDGVTPLQHARQRGYGAIVKLLTQTN